MELAGWHEVVNVVEKSIRTAARACARAEKQGHSLSLGEVAEVDGTRRNQRSLCLRLVLLNRSDYSYFQDPGRVRRRRDRSCPA